ncbi:hypothetical protein C0J52_15546 [Blattella germanica]|nr:hypothetical protein C0J52_15546 [Blattella germanica]
MDGNDVIGFHIEDYCINFIDCCQRLLRCRVDRKNLLVEHGGRTVRVRALPIGVPYDRFVQLAEAAPKVLVMFTNQKIVLGVDRLDYTKGLVHRLKAFQRLLVKYPEHKEAVTMLQISVPSRTDVKEYQDLKEEMDQLVGRINGEFTTYNWSPIRYIYGCVSQDELAGFYRDSAVALVTPLRDGMNLVAKEFVACQINKPPGVLVVSPFAGAAETMHEALICNPYEIDEAAEVLHSYIGEKNKVALLLDYDGTLAPIAPHPDLAILPVETKNVLQRLSHMSDVYVSIISGRNVYNVKEMVGIEGITYAGSHGLEILHPDGSKFVHPVPAELEEEVRNLLKALQDQARKLIADHGFKVGNSHCALEARPPVEWNKGRASIYILRTAFGYDWSERIRIIYAGDDVTDEDAMQALKGMAATFRVASSSIIRTAAEVRLTNTDSVLMMLKWLERHLSNREVTDENRLPKKYSHAISSMKVEMSFTPPSRKKDHSTINNIEEEDMPRLASQLHL